MKLMAFINEIRKQHDMSDTAFEKTKKLFICTFPYVARHLTQKEEMRVRRLLMYDLI